MAVELPHQLSYDLNNAQLAITAANRSADYLRRMINTCPPLDGSSRFDGDSIKAIYRKKEERARFCRRDLDMLARYRLEADKLIDACKRDLAKLDQSGPEYRRLAVRIDRHKEMITRLAQTSHVVREALAESNAKRCPGV